MPDYVDHLPSRESICESLQPKLHILLEHHLIDGINMSHKIRCNKGILSPERVSRTIYLQSAGISGHPPEVSCPDHGKSRAMNTYKSAFQR